MAAPGLGDFSFNLLGLLSGLIEGQAAVGQLRAEKESAAKKEATRQRERGEERAFEFTKFDTQRSQRQQELDLTAEGNADLSRYRSGQLANEGKRLTIDEQRNRDLKNYQDKSLDIANDEKILRGENAHLRNLLELLRAGGGRGRGKGKGAGGFDLDGDGTPDRAAFLLGAVMEMTKDSDSARMLKNPDDLRGLLRGINTIYDTAFPPPKPLPGLTPSHGGITQQGNIFRGGTLAPVYGGLFDIVGKLLGGGDVTRGPGNPILDLITGSISGNASQGVGPAPSHSEEISGPMPQSTPAPEIDALINGILTQNNQSGSEVPLSQPDSMDGLLNNIFDEAGPLVTRQGFDPFSGSNPRIDLEQILLQMLPNTQTGPLVTRPSYTRRRRGRNLMQTVK